jgi:hypothetical protein
VVAIDQRKRIQWVWICIGIVFLLVFAELIFLPYFATKPKSREELMHYVPTPTPQPLPSPSPAASPGVKKR